MHEASAVEALVAMLSSEVARRGGGRISSIRLVAGETRGFMVESLEFYLGLLAKGTPLEGAALSVRFVKPRLLCPACGLEFERSRFTFECPSCGGPGRMTKVGGEFYVDSIDLEEGAA